MHLILRLEYHVVSKVIKAKFIVRTVSNIRRVSLVLCLVILTREVNADTQTQKLVNRSHPIGIALRQIIVNGDYMDGLS